jgi:GrpB-like predicted nucleotidyltransferase (UPF0157 family)/predicted acetyltransferase
MSIFLETKRLVLRTTQLSDLDNLIALRSDPDVMKYIGNGSTQTKEQVESFLKNAIPYQEKYGLGFCSVFEKESGDFVGQGGLFHFKSDETQSEIEVAYRLHKKFWGRGYATELTKALIRWGFEHLPVNKLLAAAHPDNIASQKVLKKAGLDYKEKIYWPGCDGEVFLFEIYKADLIELAPYDTRWPTMAALEIKKLCEIFSSNQIVDIQHVGSTAIPGMRSKPIIDIQIAVTSLEAIKSIAIDLLKKLGYEYWDENPDPTRLFFVKGMPPFGEKRTHHVHIVELKSKHWQGKIYFRDYLISHPETAREYEQLKMKLAKEYQYDREQYTEEKSDFINFVLKNA